MEWPHPTNIVWYARIYNEVSNTIEVPSLKRTQEHQQQHEQ